MPIELVIVRFFLESVLRIVDHATAKQELDRVAVRLANAKADRLEELKFGDKNGR